FRGLGLLDTLEQVRSQEAVRPRALQPKVPRDLETVCLKCLKKQPSKRYPSAQELADDLTRYLDGKPILARRVSWRERLVKWARRRPALAGLVAVSAAAVVGGIGLLAWSQVRLEREVEEKTEQVQTYERAEAERQRLAGVRQDVRRLLDRGGAAIIR